MIHSASLLVAQITDIHLFAESTQELLGMPTAASLEAVITQLQHLHPQPDFLLLTGDLSQDGTCHSYERLQSMLSPLGIPIYWLPGNHDCLETMERSLTHPLFHAQKSFQVEDWQFILLNSRVPGRVHGQLNQESLDWLEQQLQVTGTRPTIVAFHHPPFQVNSHWLDTSTLQNPDDLFVVLDRHPQVKLVLFGHIHQEFQTQRLGITYLGTPSTCIQFEPESVHFSLDQVYPGFRLLTLYPDGTWQTSVERTAFTQQLDLAAMGY